jgi:SAM-dependent methyltransferase
MRGQAVAGYGSPDSGGALPNTSVRVWVASAGRDSKMGNQRRERTQTMNDKDLFQHYVDLNSPEAAEWNLSPECLYLQFRMRAAVKAYLTPFAGIRVLNIGIGVGDWDDFLGYWTKGFGTTTSVDIDETQCDRLRYRQEREKHANPSEVACEDILKTTLPAASFDVVTAVGSTFDEVGDTPALFNVCMGLLKPGGLLFAAPIDRNGQARQILRQASQVSAQVTHNKRYAHDAAKLRVILVEKAH